MVNVYPEGMERNESVDACYVSCADAVADVIPYVDDGREFAQCAYTEASTLTKENFLAGETKVLANADKYTINELIQGLTVGEVVSLDYSKVSHSTYTIPAGIQDEVIHAIMTSDGFKTLNGPASIIGKRPLVYNFIETTRKAPLSFEGGNQIAIPNATPFKIHELVQDIGPLTISQASGTSHAVWGEVTEHGKTFSTYVDTETGKRVKLLGEVVFTPDKGNVDMNKELSAPEAFLQLTDADTNQIQRDALHVDPILFANDSLYEEHLQLDPEEQITFLESEFASQYAEDYNGEPLSERAEKEKLYPQITVAFNNVLPAVYEEIREDFVRFVDTYNIPNKDIIRFAYLLKGENGNLVRRRRNYSSVGQVSRAAWISGRKEMGVDKPPPWERDNDYAALVASYGYAKKKGIFAATTTHELGIACMKYNLGSYSKAALANLHVQASGIRKYTAQAAGLDLYDSRTIQDAVSDGIIQPSHVAIAAQKYYMPSGIV